MKTLGKMGLVAATWLIAGVHPAGALNDAGQIEVSPKKLDFGTTAVGTCRPKKVEVRNDTGVAIKDPGFRIVGTETFFLQEQFACPKPLLPGDSCRVYVDFCPPLYVDYRGALAFSDSDETIPLLGRTHGTSQ